MEIASKKAMASKEFRLYGRTIQLTILSQLIVQVFYLSITLAGMYLIWLISPNIYVALALIYFGTLLGFHIGMACVNIVAFFLSELEKFTSWTAPNDIVRLVSSQILKYYGKLFHGYVIDGKENLPTSSGALLVYHHALLPLDVIYLGADMYTERRRTLGGILDYAMCIQLQGVAMLFDFFPGRDRLVADLKKGHIRSVAPGGGFEAAFSENYDLLWKGRTGFARVAKECGVPVIPMFMVNSEQAMPIKTYGFRDFQKRMLEKYRFMVFMPLICFPVKLRIIIGKPMYCGTEETPERFADRVKMAIYELRDEHQRRPGSVLLALSERFGYRPFRAEAEKID